MPLERILEWQVGKYQGREIEGLKLEINKSGMEIENENWNWYEFMRSMNMENENENENGD